MHSFDKIWFDGTTVRLFWSDGADGAQDRHDWEHDAPPTGEFKDSFQAFVPFALDLLGLPNEWLDSKVRSLSIKREAKTNARGLKVTFMRKIKASRNQPVVITTPYLSEPAAGYSGDGVGYLDDVTLKLLDTMQEQATKYKNGEHGGQQTLKLEDSANSKAFDERAAAAAVATTRKPRRGKEPKDFMPGVGIIANPNATEPPFSDEQLRQLLLSVDRDVPIDAIGQWIRGERIAVEAWARARQRELMGMHDAHMTTPPEPDIVITSATLPLKAEEKAAEEGEAADD